jgi:hypothetical protein
VVAKGFTQRPDPSIYIYDQDGIKVIVPIFVDDITLAGESEKYLDNFVAKLATNFKLRDLGPISFLLGIEITQNHKRRTISLSQHQYILNKLQEFGMSDCHAVGTPMDPGVKLSSIQSPKTLEKQQEMHNIPYMNAVGSMMHLATATRPDIVYTAGVRYQESTPWAAIFQYYFLYILLYFNQ